MSTELQPWQQRVVDEKRELDEKIAKLNAFIDTSQFLALPDYDRFLLMDQYSAMWQYSYALGARIERFQPEFGL